MQSNSSGMHNVNIVEDLSMCNLRELLSITKSYNIVINSLVTKEAKQGRQLCWLQKLAKRIALCFAICVFDDGKIATLYTESYFGVL